MFNLQDPKISYLIFSPEKVSNTLAQNRACCDNVCSILYAKDYTVFPVVGLYKEEYEASFIAIAPSIDAESLKSDGFLLMDKFQQESVIIKYFNETSAVKIFSNGSEKELQTVIYDGEYKDKTYLYNGISFSFVEKKKYFFPKKKEDLKSGMIVEYFNNNRWIPKEIQNPESEFEKMFKLLIKYEKVRVECK